MSKTTSASQPLPTLLDRALEQAPHWAEEKILTWDENDFDQNVAPFVISEYWNDSDSVNVFRIVGTKHWNYQGKTWINMLQTGKRMAINLPLHQSNPGYYLDQKHKKPTMSYVTLDGITYYVADDGNHRSTIARFDFHYAARTMLHGVRTTHYSICHPSKALYDVITEWLNQEPQRKARYRIEPRRIGRNREDESGWKQDHYQIVFDVDDHLKQQYLTNMSLDKVSALWEAWKQPTKRGLFSGWRK